MEKLTKAQAGYQLVADCEYLCGQCLFEKDTKLGDACAYFGPTHTISEDHGGCIQFVHCDPAQSSELPWIPMFSKEKLGYEETPHGFGCRRCEHFLTGANDCSRVDRKSPGASPGEISPMGCCNVWEPDQKRAKMTTPALLQLLAGGRPAGSVMHVKPRKE